MGDPKHMQIIKDGVSAWNKWRKSEPRVQPDLTHIDLSYQNLSNVDFRGVGLYEACLEGAILRGSNLRQARLIRTNLTSADLTGSKVWGVSVWDVKLDKAVQEDLVITPRNTSIITVDNIEVAQFLYLLISNESIRRILDTITTKVVLILGRFKPERKSVLDLVKKELRKKGLIPVLFDFQGPENRNLTETVQTLACLAKFIVADLTDPSCIPHELMSIAPIIRLPIYTIIKKGETPYAMFSDLPSKYPWVQKVIEYENNSDIKRIVEDLAVM